MAEHAAVYYTAGMISELGFATDDSVFEPGRAVAVWTRQNAEELAARLEHPPPGEYRTFLEKLRAELTGARPEVVQLAAEILFLHFLPVSNIKGATKRAQINAVFGEAALPVWLVPQLKAALDDGVIRVGRAFNSQRAQQMIWLARVVAHVKSQPPAVVKAALEDPWAFRALVDAVPAKNAAGQRRALLWVLFPDVFLGSVSGKHLSSIVQAFRDEVEVLTGDDERDFAAIRETIEEREGPVDFYARPWSARWGWGESSDAAELVTYRPGWLVRGTKTKAQGRNLVPEWLRDGYCSITLSEYPRVEPGLSRSDLAKVVRGVEPELSPAQEGARVTLLDRFLTRMKPGDLVVTVNESRVHVGVLAGEATWAAETDMVPAHQRRAVQWLDTPRLHRTDLSDTAQDRLSGQASVVELGEVAREIAELVDLDGIDATGITDLSAEVGADMHASAGLAGVPVDGEVPRPTTIVVEAPPLEELPAPTAEMAGRLLVDHDWLVEVVELLTEKKQLVLYGPPGTGKTYLAQELARFAEEETNGGYRLVQFHPSYAYEDFVEGFRPSLSPDGTFRFAKEHGPLRRLVDAALGNPSGAYALVIDEINRANLAKVFGELYFLLEYRNRTINLQYSPDDLFRLPPNVFVIGTMNTADRSIALVDAAMRRRFAWQALFPGEPPVDGMLRRWLAQEGLPGQVADLLDALNAAIGDRDAAVGPSYLMNRRVGERKGLERIWRTQILPLLEEHHAGEHPDVTAYVRDRYGLSALHTALEATAGGARVDGGPGVATPDGS